MKRLIAHVQTIGSRRRGGTQTSTRSQEPRVITVGPHKYLSTGLYTSTDRTSQPTHGLLQSTPAPENLPHTQTDPASNVGMSLRPQNNTLTPGGYAWVHPQLTFVHVTVSHPFTAIAMDCVKPCIQCQPIYQSQQEAICIYLNVRYIVYLARVREPSARLDLYTYLCCELVTCIEIKLG